METQERLERAIYKNNEKLIINILANDIDEVDIETALVISVRESKFKIADTLLNHTAELCHDAKYSVLTWIAQFGGSEDLFERILDVPVSKTNLELTDPDLLSIAAQKGREEIARILLKRGADPCKTPICEYYSTEEMLAPIENAAIFDRLNVFKLFVESGVKLDGGNLSTDTELDRETLMYRSLSRWNNEEGECKVFGYILEITKNQEIPSGVRRMIEREGKTNAAKILNAYDLEKKLSSSLKPKQEMKSRGMKI